jgi:hypothetical protein
MPRCIYQTVNPARTHTVRVMSPNQCNEYAVRIAEMLPSGAQAILSCGGTYFTTDREDAIATAHFIAQRFAHLRRS